MPGISTGRIRRLDAVPGISMGRGAGHFYGDSSRHGLRNSPEAYRLARSPATVPLSPPSGLYSARRDLSSDPRAPGHPASVLTYGEINDYR